MATTTSQISYCLRGLVQDSEHSFVLGSTNGVGSLPSNEIVLSAAGVSRQHARLTLGIDQLQVEDLGSKNGTYLNERRIEQATARPGDQLRFGPVELTLEELDSEDAELAIALDYPPLDRSSAVLRRETPLVTSSIADALTRHWLQLVEALVTEMPEGPDGHFSAVVRLLISELQLRGTCLLELPAEERPIVLAAAGQVDDDAMESLQEALPHAFADATTKADAIAFELLNPTAGAPLSLVLLTPQDAAPLALALWGSFAGRSESEPLLRLVVRLVDRFRPQPGEVHQPTVNTGFPSLVVPAGFVFGQSAAMRRIYRLMESLARGDLPVLIIGDTGVGKEYLAQILHRSSPRRQQPFVAINCAAIPAELLESELFGIGEGVASGVRKRRGRFQEADGGTLFLDEIGDMSAGLQAKLLRALQEKEVTPLGMRPIKIDVRVLAATNQELAKRIEAGSFRADLYYRLAGWVLDVPPLGDRPEDIPALVEHFLRDCSRSLGKRVRGLTVRALRQLVDFPWPGNVRELENEVRRLVYLCHDGAAIDSSMLSKAVLENAPRPVLGDSAARALDLSASPPAASDGEPRPELLALDSLELEDLEQRAVREALRRCDGNQVQAAKLLAISRQKLRRRMERFGLLPGPS